jgi:hypothetical protein
LNPGDSSGWLAWLTLIVGSQLERSLGVNPFCEPVRSSSATPALPAFAAARASLCTRGPHRHPKHESTTHSQAHGRHRGRCT